MKSRRTAIEIVLNGLTPQMITLFACTGAAVWMAVAGVKKNALEWRRRRRHCPSCGRMIDGRVCGHCA